MQEHPLLREETANRCAPVLATITGRTDLLCTAACSSSSSSSRSGGFKPTNGYDPHRIYTTINQQQQQKKRQQLQQKHRQLLHARAANTCSVRQRKLRSSSDIRVSGRRSSSWCNSSRNTTPPGVTAAAAATKQQLPSPRRCITRLLQEETAAKVASYAARPLPKSWLAS